MPYLAWSDELDTHIPELDAQHRVMIEHVNRLAAAASSGSSRQIREAMAALADCVRQHFAFEERVLEMIDFAGLEEHRQTHRNILAELDDYRARLETASPAEAEELVDTLGPWVVEHIRHDDVDFGPTVREWLRDAAPPNDPFRQLVGDS
ncbi:bacteriohemerythrin [Thioalkalivibrio paradoxus]|uniref:Hemerythrin-like domain-containing protein n=1 Tax=Thioalkalivibrio paradoxus ARh 1 TaxID=713585 RepID=W0DJX5_9GAMM|nr:hemerythrin family protein [Thioalkalivibrio paradoxus]AHE98746.1 hypothetical protein THITH_11370 [Thioalkalivibrio paradoxus ARh 1]